MCEEPLRATTHGPAAAAHRLHHAPRADLLRRGGAPPGGFQLVTSYRFHDHGAAPGPPRRHRHATPRGTARHAVVRRLGDGPDHQPRPGPRQAGRAGRLLARPGRRPLDERARRGEASGDSSEMPVVDADGNEKRRKKRVIPYVEDRRNILVLKLAEPLRARSRALADVRAGARHRGGVPAGGLRADQRAAAAGRRPARPDAVHRGGRGRRRCAAPAAGGAGRPGPRRRRGLGDLPLRRRRQRPGRRSTRTGRARAAATTACSPTATSSTTRAIDRHSVRGPAAALRRRRGAGPPAGASPASEQLAPARPTQADSSAGGRSFVAWLKARGLRLPDEAQTSSPRRSPGPTSSTDCPAPTSRSSSTARHEHASRRRARRRGRGAPYDAGWDVVRFPLRRRLDARSSATTPTLLRRPVRHA